MRKWFVVFIRRTPPLLLKVCAQTWLHTSHTQDLCLYMTFMAFIDKNQNDQCFILLFTLHSSLLDVKQQNNNNEKKKKTAIILVKSHSSSFTVISPSLNKHKWILILLPWLLLITEILLWLSLKKAPKKARMWIAVSNLYILYIHSEDHLCTCYILSHSGYLSSPSDRHRHGITSPFLNPFQEKSWTSDPMSVPEEQETPIYTYRPSHRYSTCWLVNWLVCETVVCLTLVLFFLAACNNNSMKQQCFWVLLNPIVSN